MTSKNIPCDIYYIFFCKTKYVYTSGVVCRSCPCWLFFTG
nr:MAG TPA: hypothetical protein [Caudoviricetes sp.]